MKNACSRKLFNFKNVETASILIVNYIRFCQVLFKMILTYRSVAFLGPSALAIPPT